MKKKVSYETFPGLRLLTREKQLDVIINKSLIRADEEWKDILNNNVDLFKSILSDCKKNMQKIDYFSPTYCDAVIDSSDAIYELVNKEGELPHNLCEILGAGDLCGTCIFNQEKVFTKVGKGARTYVFYRIKNNFKRIELFEVDQISKNYLFLTTAFVGSVHYMTKDKIMIRPEFKCSDTSLGLLIKILVFQKIAKTELEYFDLVDENKVPKGTSKFNIMSKAPSEGVNINYYSANWYKEILVDHDFSVVGHWRNQPTNNGVKLIFIKPYVKHGYHRKASKDQAEVIY